MSPLVGNLIRMLWNQWEMVEQQIEELGDELDRISAAYAGCTRILEIAGIGVNVATAIEVMRMIR